MAIRERISGGIEKHSAIEMFALILAVVVISAIILYLLIINGDFAISFTTGDLLMVYVPSMLLAIIGAGAMSYGKQASRKYVFGIGIGMLFGGVAFLVLQTLQILFFGVS